VPLQIYNTLTRSKEPFEPITPGVVGFYRCGPTVQNFMHVGHGKTYVASDLILRWLRRRGYRVRYVQNITDVGHLLDSGEDRILKASRAAQLEPMEVAETYTRYYFRDLDRLNIIRPDISPRATGHILEQQEMISALIAKGHAYESNGSVYFHIPSFPEYGKLSGRQASLEEQLEGTRVEARGEKRDPRDFALWKRAGPEHIMRWNSPWGPGFPGWHIECSAMSTKYLGEYFDIHMGGLDNMFPHHECEIAQCEGVFGHPFVKYWVHSNMLELPGGAMHRSAGNAVNLANLYERHDPMAFRLFVLQTHYRQAQTFSEEAVAAAGVAHRRLLDAWREAKAAAASAPEGKPGELSQAVTGLRREFDAAMDDDFNSAGALAAIFEFVKTLNTALAAGINRADAQAAAHALDEYLDEALGLVPADDAGAGVRHRALAEKLVESLLAMREEYRKARDFKRADGIRDLLTGLGVEVQDSPQGSKFKLP
jgi:cysteinyl-tRNA synthetase